MVTKSEMQDIMEMVFKECQGLREEGQKEYAHDDGNAFANFERVASDLGLSREQILWVYARKHMDGVVSWINGHRSQREDVRGRINDLIVYLCLLRGMVDDIEKQNESENWEYINANTRWLRVRDQADQPRQRVGNADRLQRPGSAHQAVFDPQRGKRGT